MEGSGCGKDNERGGEGVIKLLGKVELQKWTEGRVQHLNVHTTYIVLHRAPWVASSSYQYQSSHLEKIAPVVMASQEYSKEK